MAVCMEVSEMGESRGGKEVQEHTALASLLVLSRAVRIANWLLVECRVVVGKACMLMVNFERWEWFGWKIGSVRSVMLFLRWGVGVLIL